jgi:formate hydrogenlyase transcriptional activator
LPVRHLLVLRDKTTSAQTEGSAEADKNQIPSWVQDYALFLLDVNGRIVGWYSGAARIYGYDEDEAAGRHVSILYPGEENPSTEPQQELNRSAAEGHFGNEGWHARKDGARFWANVITMALRDETGELQGFARVVRDFSERHERDEKLRRNRARARPVRRRLHPLLLSSGSEKRRRMNARPMEFKSCVKRLGSSASLYP